MALEAAATLLLPPLLSSKPKPGSYLSLRLRTNRFATSRTGLLPPFHNKTALSQFTILPLALRKAVSKEEEAKETESSSSSSTAVTEPPVRIVALVGEGSLSPLKNAPWLDVMLHTVCIHF